MTKNEAQTAMDERTTVEAGKGDDHDTGRIVAIDGDTAMVAWDSGVRTPCALVDLRVA